MVYIVFIYLLWSIVLMYMGCSKLVVTGFSSLYLGNLNLYLLNFFFPNVSFRYAVSQDIVQITNSIKVTSKSWNKLKNIALLLVKLRRKFKMVGRLQMIHDEILEDLKYLCWIWMWIIILQTIEKKSWNINSGQARSRWRTPVNEAFLLLFL
jgi:hypothetical protein